MMNLAARFNTQREYQMPLSISLVCVLPTYRLLLTVAYISLQHNAIKLFETDKLQLVRKLEKD